MAMRVFLLICSCLVVLAACAPQPPRPSPGHLSLPEKPQLPKHDIPQPVQQLAYLPPPDSTADPERYSVVVNQIPVSELLFALARDASLNVDIHPAIQGWVTLNAIDQTLPQILQRISRQIDLRYELKDNSLSITPDLPYVHTYQVDYVNLSRETKSEVAISTEIDTDIRIAEGGTGTTGGQGGANGGNRSEITVSNQSSHQFWDNIVKNLHLLVGGKTRANNPEDLVIANPESGLVTVHATHRQHQEVQKFLDRLMGNVQRQVLIEATIVEVTLKDTYQAGVDWKRISGDFTYQQNLMNSESIIGNGLLGETSPYYLLHYSNPVSAIGNISATLRLLEQFGDVKVLSSPRLMALNNQTALLKVVDNEVYFSINVERREKTETTNESVEYDTEIHTVPVGLIMSVTPQISSDNKVTLSVRPTILRVIGYVEDPNPILAKPNLIPQTQVREIESILKVNSGEVAVIGGLMEDKTNRNTDGVPVLSSLPTVGDLFSYRNDNYTKTELLVFLRPVVIKDASLNGDLRDYRRYLPNPEQPDRNPPTGLQLNPEQLYPPPAQAY